MRKRFWILFVLAVFALAIAGCGDDDGDGAGGGGGNGGGDADGEAAGEGGGGDGDDGGGGGGEDGDGGGGGGGGDGNGGIDEDCDDPPSTFTGIVKNLTDLDDPEAGLEGSEVTILNNASAYPIEGFGTQTSDTDGKVTFTNIHCKYPMVGFKIISPGETHLNAYTFSVDPAAVDEDLVVVDKMTLSIAAGAAGVTLDETKGNLGGILLWGGGEEPEPVGCATVELDSEGEIRYVKGGAMPLPVPPEDLAYTDPAVGVFIIANVPEGGPITITAKIGGEAIATTTTHSFANSLSYTKIMVEGDANPTPEDCSVE